MLSLVSFSHCSCNSQFFNFLHLFVIVVRLGEVVWKDRIVECKHRSVGELISSGSMGKANLFAKAGYLPCNRLEEN